MKSSLRRGLLVAAVAASSAAAHVPFAAATVHVDPNGPAGQQYAFPLDSARGQASGTPDAGVPGATAKAPLFGQGIRPGASSGKRAKAAPNRQGRRQAPDGSGTRAVDQAAAAAANGGGSTALWIVALIAAVVLLGAAAGLIARRGLGAEQRG